MTRAPADAVQSEIAEFLSDPVTHGLDSGHVERIETHGALVFLAGARAYKIKRAVRYPYLDYSTLEKRRAACAREVELNRRTAPELYLKAAPITREASGRLSIDGAGKPVEWVVVMARFDHDDAFDVLADRGALTPDLLEALADAIAAFHGAARTISMSGAKQVETLRLIAEDNARDLQTRPDLFEPAKVAELERATLDLLDRFVEPIAARAASGFVRHCHGDLHLRNVCLWRGRPTLFDCIEFSDAYATGDVMYDLAFLLMDLIERNLVAEANLVLNRYMGRTDDIEGLAPLPLFLSMRAAIRAKVAAAAERRHSDPAEARHQRAEAADYLAAALRYLALPSPRLVVVGGLSGSGKTSLARRLAPHLDSPPGALHLRSDVLRKRLFGVDERERLPPRAYDDATTGKVYRTLIEGARRCLVAGRAVVADAVFARPSERRAVAEAAAAAGMPFAGLWIEVPNEVLMDRVGGRTDDASDADADVVRRQIAYDLGPIDWRRIDGSGTPEAVAQQAKRILEESI
jgi:aminoglycoside phosphotransferase family enzyme